MAEKYLESVLGRVDAAHMKWVHSHEHLLLDYCQCQGRRLDEFPGNLEYGRRRLIEMARELKQYGVNGIVDATPYGIGRDEVYVALAKEVSQASGVHIFLATGLYSSDYWPDWAREWTIIQIADLLTQELEVGIKDTEVKACFIKVAVDTPFGPATEKALTSAAIAQRRTGAAIHCHCSNDRRETIELLTSLGVDSTRIYLAHVDMNTSEEEFLWLAELGVGLVTTNWEFPYHMDQEEARRLLKVLIERGYLSRILVSIDFALQVYDRWRMAWFSWDNPDRTSYSYLHTGVIPKLRAAGLDDEQLDWIMRRNPIEMLCRK